MKFKKKFNSYMNLDVISNNELSYKEHITYKRKCKYYGRYFRRKF